MQNHVSNLGRVLIVSLLFTLSCKSADNPVYLDATSVLKNIIFPSPTGSQSGWVQSIIWRTNGLDTIVDNHEQHAVFYDTTGVPVSAGVLQVNGVSVPSSQKDYLARIDLGSASQVVWHIGGNGGFPALTDSITPPNSFRLTTPYYPSDSISVSNFSIRYDNPGTDSVLIIVRYDSLKSVRRADSTLRRPNSFFYVKAACTGSCTIAQSAISSFGNSGIAQIMVIAVNQNTRLLQGRPCQFSAVAAATSLCYLKP